MPKNDLEWHKSDINDEYAEYLEARGLVNRWSELADVVYTYTRALWSGHTDVEFPFNKLQYFIGTLYMFPKYSLRWNFFNKLGKKFDKNLEIKEVRNPKKIEKLDNSARKYNLDTTKFSEEAKKLMKYRIFLK